MEILPLTDKQDKALSFFKKAGEAIKFLFYRFTVPSLLFIFALGIIAISSYVHNRQNVLLKKAEVQELSLYDILEKSKVIYPHPVLLTKNIFDEMEKDLQDNFFVLLGSLFFYFFIFIFVIRKLKANSERSESLVVQLQGMNTELHKEISARDEMALKLKSLNGQLKFQSLHDSLTQLPNRLLFEDRLNINIQASRRNNLIFAVMLLDLDNFKLINDTLGHDAGDELLKEVSKRLSESIRGMDTVARLGGDEFAFILTALDVPENAVVVCDRILQKLTNTIVVKNQLLNINASIGISIFPQDGDIAQVLLKNADIAMYHAKNFGRGNFQFYRESMNVTGKRELHLRNRFHDALKNSALTLHYQPIVDMEKHAIISFEALLRWHDPELGDVSPLEILRIASHLRLQVQLNDWVLEKICKQINEWKEKKFDVPKVSMNVTSLEMDSKSFITKFKNKLEKFNVSGEKIILEINESTLVSNTADVLTVLTELNNLGIKIAVDDFGTGYSSLSYLQKFPIQILKIDRGFINELHNDKSNFALIQVIISIGNALKVDLIAEGVETKEQLDILLKLGCSKFQGFLFSKALAPDDCINIIIPTGDSYA